MNNETRIFPCDPRGFWSRCDVHVWNSILQASGKSWLSSLCWTISNVTRKLGSRHAYLYGDHGWSWGRFRHAQEMLSYYCSLHSPQSRVYSYCIFYCISPTCLVFYQPSPTNWPPFTPRGKSLEQHAEPRDIIIWTKSRIRPLAVPKCNDHKQRWGVIVGSKWYIDWLALCSHHPLRPVLLGHRSIFHMSTDTKNSSARAYHASKLMCAQP